MPYRRNYRRRGGYRRRYPRKGNGATDYIKMAKAAYSGVKYLRGLVNVEKHALYTSLSGTPDSTSGVLQCLNLIAQGDGETDRTGDSVMIKSVHANIKYTMNAAATGTTIRTILFWYKQPQGATPISTFVLQGVSQMSCYNHDNAGLYTVLYDSTTVLNITGNQEICKSFTRKFYNIHETFDGVNANIGDIQTNALWILFISDEATNTPTITGRAEILYVDN